MITPLTCMVADGYVPERSYELGRSPAAITGIDRPTIGYELEITEASAVDTPVLSDSLSANFFALNEGNKKTAGKYGYGLVHEQEYELASPVGDTPVQLALITSGLVTIGWVPEHTDAETPLHINVSVPTLPNKPQDSLLPRAIDMLRIIDILGGSSDQRLEQSYREGFSIINYWDDRGYAGVSLTRTGRGGLHPLWKGDKDRMELRSPTYRDLNQFLHALERAYYLTAGLTAAPESDAMAAYDSFENFIADYFDFHGLTSAGDIDLRKLDSFDCGNGKRSARNMKKYLSPFVRHIREDDESAREDLAQATTRTMVEIRKTLAMEEVPMGSNDEIKL